MWPALWLLPTKQKYGGWPRSGEIDLMESRGNRNYTNSEGKQIGVEHFGSTLHFGPSWDQNGYSTTLMNKNTPSNQGFNKGFHRYQMDWTPEFMKFSVDGHEVGTINVGGGFWARGGFQGENIWKNGARMAPFDDEVSVSGVALACSMRSSRKKDMRNANTELTIIFHCFHSSILS